MPDLDLLFNQGFVSSRGRETLAKGELQSATGIHYKPGDPIRAHKILGRSQFDDIAAGIVKGVALCQFDTGGADKLVALHGTDYFGATPGVTGAFASLLSGLTSAATRLHAAHFDDRWYLANGYDRVRVLENDGTVRLAGLDPPTTDLTFTTSSGTATVDRPSTETNSGWVNPSFARDTDLTTFSYATHQGPTQATKTVTWKTFPSRATANRVCRIICRFDAPSINIIKPIGTTGGLVSGYIVTLTVEVSSNLGGAWTTLYTEERRAPHFADLVLQHPISVNSDQVWVRATFVYSLGTFPATFRVYDIQIRDAGDAANFTPDEPFYYAITEYDAVNGMESPPGPPLKITPTNFVAQNRLTLTLPAAVNTRSTNFYIYRTFDGGTVPQDLGFLGAVPIAATTFTDEFVAGKTVDDELEPIVPLVLIPDRTTGEGELFFPRDAPPPTLAHVTAWKGALVGTSREFPRELRYSYAGMPESWPIIYVISKFPLPEHDEIVATAPCAETLLIFMKGAVLTLTDLPQALDGVFNASEASPLRAAPGCVGSYAVTAYSVAGEPRVAWVSTFGIYASNGQTVWRLSDDLAWTIELSVAQLGSAALHWDSKRQVIIFAYDSDGGGTNDRFFLLHMAPEHAKENGPKITGPHYGSINCMASGVVSGSYRLYSGHVSDGTVYLEEGAATDASSSYSGTQVPLIVKTGRLYGDWRDWYAYKANLRHTDFGAGETCSVVWSWGRDAGQTGSVTKSAVSLANQKGTEFFIGRSGEWAEMQITHTGIATGTAALLDCRVDTQVMEKSGRKAG